MQILHSPVSFILIVFDFLKKRKSYPPFWREYEDCFKESWPKEAPVEEIRFVVLDTETTGLLVKKDKILSIAAAGLKNNRLDMEDTFECYVNQEIKPGESVTVHGILSKETRGGLPEDLAIRNFLAFCKDSVLVGQHIGFDVAVFNAALKGMGAGKLENTILDTAKLALMAEHPFDPYYVVQKPEEYSLDALCKRYNIPAQERHTAAGDVYITAILFLKLLARLRQRGLNTLGDLKAVR